MIETYSHDIRKTLLYVFLLIITIAYLLIFLNSLYMKLFLWKNRQLVDNKSTYNSDNIIIPIQEIFDYKLFLNSYQSYYISDSKCLNLNYNDDVVLTTNYNLYLNGLILKVLFTYIFLWLFINIIIYLSSGSTSDILPPIPIKDIVNIFSFLDTTDSEPNKDQAIYTMFIIIFFIPFIYIYSFSSNSFQKKYKLDYENENGDSIFENYMFYEIKNLIHYNDKKDFNKLKKFFENSNKYSIGNFIETKDDKRKLKYNILRTETETEPEMDKKSFEICENYILLCHALSNINKYTNVDVVKNMLIFLNLCEKEYDENNRSGYKISKVKINKEEIENELKSHTNLTISFIHETVKKLDIFDYDNNKEIENEDFETFLKNLEILYNENYITYDSDKNTFLSSLSPDNKKINANESLAKLRSRDNESIIIYTFNDNLNNYKDNIETYIIDDLKKDDLEEIYNNDNDEEYDKQRFKYIITFKNDNSNPRNLLNTFGCIFSNDTKFAFDKNLGFIGKIMAGTLLDTELKKSEINNQSDKKIFFISMLTKHELMKEDNISIINGDYFNKLISSPYKDYYKRELKDNYNKFKLYININGILFGMFTFILIFLISFIVYKKIINKNIIDEINFYLLNTKTKKGNDYIIMLFVWIVSFIIKQKDKSIVPSISLCIAFLIFLIILFQLDYPYNYIWIFILYLFPYLVLRYYLSTSTIFAFIFFIVVIIILIYIKNILKNNNDNVKGKNILSEFIKSLIIYIIVIIVLVFIGYGVKMFSSNNFTFDTNKNNYITDIISIFIILILSILLIYYILQ